MAGHSVEEDGDEPNEISDNEDTDDEEEEKMEKLVESKRERNMKLLQDILANTNTYDQNLKSGER
jgi:hypothetical protein